jgi:periplasmic protein TonB
MAASFTFKPHENRTLPRRAFAISFAAHALLLLLLVLFAGRNLGNPLEVRLVIETDLQRLEVPEEEEIPASREKRRSSRGSAKRKPGRGSNATTDRPSGPVDPWSDYERKMHRSGRDHAERPNPASAQTAWGTERTGKASKRGENETAVAPPGSTGSSTRWKKGAARRLVSLPAIDYPESIRKKSGQGRVELMIEVGPDGRVEEIEVIRSSGYPRLDMNARNAYRNAVFSPSASGESATGVVVVTFRMRDN